MTPLPSRAGFSLIESVVVLAITGMLLILLFGIAGRSASNGFRTAGRSLAKADSRIGAESLRVLLRGVRLPERGRQEASFVGQADSLQTATTPLRPTACTGAAPSPALRIWLSSEGGRTRLLCAPAGAQQAVTLLDLGRRQAAFGYALAGRDWSDRLTVQLPSRQAAGTAPAQGAAPPRLWVRLASTDGEIEIIEAADPPPRAAPSAG